jgi:hypothetical protein
VRTVYSTRFAALTLAPSGSLSAIYTVPSGFVAVLRDIDGIVTSGGAGQLFLGMGATWWFEMPLLAATSGFQWRGRQVFLAGETISAQTVTATVQMHVTGYLLSA